MTVAGHVPAGSLNDVFPGTSELAGLMRAFDWSSTPLGPALAWPQALKTCVRILLTSRQPMWLGWGEQLNYLYNDAYKSIIGGKHPWALGRPTRDVWREIWREVGPRVETTMQGKEGTYDEALLLIMERHGYREETYYTFSYSPIPDDHGGVGGLFCANTDDTRRIVGERQLGLLRELATRTVAARTVADACVRSARALEANAHDLPFGLIYLIEADPDGGQRAVLAGATHADAGPSALPAVVPLGDAARGGFAELTDVARMGEARLIEPLTGLTPRLPTGAWDEPPTRAIALPIASSGELRTAGILVAGLNPFRTYDAEYRGFLELVTGQIAAAISNAQAYDEERRRGEALAEIDRAKTTFFSNVSHEFRTPLTLMLGPVEDLLAGSHGELRPEQRQELVVAQRNSMRLLRLVNTLLDFARIEAGRVQANYERTDIGTYTAELTSTFRTAVERAGVRLSVESPPLGPDVEVYVDREMWEKIVLNLLSNALKFTFDGEIGVALHPSADHARVQFTVSDTGTGIPADELPRLFERFHRVQGARARTHEGTGIGLALVQELVRLHGGTVAVESRVGLGTTFNVVIPMGSAHLPSERIDAPRTMSSTALGAAPFVEEALRWLPDGAESGMAEPRGEDEAVAALGLREQLPPIGGHAARPARILLADDSADMRAYVTRLLVGQYAVQAVPDGASALNAAQAEPPDLVLSDVMMPGLDGFGLLRAIREDPRLREIPVILLSARAGEEATVEGIEAGADDYLVKPFSARELLARVATHLQLASVRSAAAESERAARAEAELALAARSEFLSIAAHELRTPIAGLKAITQMLTRALERDRLDSDRLRTNLVRMERAADRLSVLVSDLLDVSRLQTGRLRLEPVPIDLGSLAAQVVASVMDVAAVRRQTIELEASDTVPLVEADPMRMEQVIANLLDNALKYSPEGTGVRVRIGSAADADGMLVTVEDSGIGLPPGAAEFIFDPFGRAANAAERSIQGLGLGLYISRQIVERHGGRIWAESSGEGRGTTLSVWLPAARHTVI